VNEDVDVLIAGNGPVGTLLALALAQAGIDHRLVGDQRQERDRPIALGYSSRILLERVQSFRALAATPIQTIHVSQRGGFGRTLISAADYSLPALGYVVSYTDLCAALRQRLAAPWLSAHVSRYSPSAQGDSLLVETRGAGAPQTWRVRLLVLAEGGVGRRSAAGDESAAFHRGREPRELKRDYGQSAVVALVRAELAHGNRAWERFTPDGPLALLPYGERLALVWSTTHQSAHALCALTDGAFLARLGATFGGRLGRFVETGARGAFALALRYQRGSPDARVLAVGNSSQTLHPVAGQGLNLGLRDAWELVRSLDGVERTAIGSTPFIRRYLLDRSIDRETSIRVTDGLVRIFSNANPALALARGVGLAAMDLVPPARHFLARRMMFGARAMP
jgi:2-octaprenyl-6-methoxyphenol hydroxylase